MNKLYDLFLRCNNAKYIHTDNDGDYCVERDNDILYIFFQPSASKIDWKNNFDFPAIPYKHMGVKWKCHRGFLRVWKSIEPYLAPYISDMTVSKIYIVGYSMGAALASLCHEYVWYNRPDLRENSLEGFGYGCPRVFWGHMNKQLKQRWKHFHPIRNCNDLITHLPPRIFGYKHVNKVFTLSGKKNKTRHTAICGINSHYPDNYQYNLEKETYENIHK